MKIPDKQRELEKGITRLKGKDREEVMRAFLELLWLLRIEPIYLIKGARETLQRYLLLVKIDPLQINNVLRAFKTLPERPMTGVKVGYSCNVLGCWDACIWFVAETFDQVSEFVLNKIRPIPGVLKTLTMPATSINEYKS